MLDLLIFSLKPAAGCINSEKNSRFDGSSNYSALFSRTQEGHFFTTSWSTELFPIFVLS